MVGDQMTPKRFSEIYFYTLSSSTPRRYYFDGLNLKCRKTKKKGQDSEENSRVTFERFKT